MKKVIIGIIIGFMLSSAVAFCHDSWGNPCDVWENPCDIACAECDSCRNGEIILNY